MPDEKPYTSMRGMARGEDRDFKSVRAWTRRPDWHLGEPPTDHLRGLAPIPGPAVTWRESPPEPMLVAR